MQYGIDRLAGCERLLAELRTKKLGVLCHAASVDRCLVHVLDLLAELGIRPSLLFAPEHGFGAAAQDMATIGEELEPPTGGRIVSLYGSELADLVPRERELAEIDLLVVDLQERVGHSKLHFLPEAE